MKPTPARSWAPKRFINGTYFMNQALVLLTKTTILLESLTKERCSPLRKNKRKIDERTRRREQLESQSSMMR
jgi:hypothetical protein